MPRPLSETLVVLLGPDRSGRTKRLTDVVLVVAVVAIGLPNAMDVDGGPPDRWVRLALVAGLGVPLLWRRRWPLAVFGVVAATAFLQWLTGVRLAADVALLLALYTVSVARSWRHTVAAGLVLEVGIVLAGERWAPSRLRLVAVVLLSGTAAAAFFTGVTMRTVRAYLGELQERARRYELERDQQARLAAAAERARIAREMHDIVAHNVAVMTALADGATLTAPADPERAATAMRQVSATGRQALTEMRRLLGVLRDDVPAELSPQPGLADLDALLAQLRLVGLRADLAIEGVPPESVAPGLQLIVYRLVQEAVTNILKHAPQASAATVLVSCESGVLRVDVHDDGPATGMSSTAGHGIVGMKERSAVYGGSVTAGPAAHGGWSVRARFDLASAGAAV